MKCVDCHTELVDADGYVVTPTAIPVVSPGTLTGHDIHVLHMQHMMTMRCRYCRELAGLRTREGR